MPVLAHVIILVFGGVVSLAAILFFVVDMFGRVDYLKDKFPSLERILEKRSAIGGLLVITVFLLVGDGLELSQKEFPDVESPIIKITPPIIQTVPTTVTVTLPTQRESQDSLRKRILRVADALDAFNRERAELRSRVPDARDASGKVPELAKFDTETNALYVSSSLKEKTVEIIRDIKSKGLDTGFLEMWAKQSAIQGGMFPMWNNNDSALPLREYAFHFDANGNVVHIDY
jgi:hypothetical protein